MGDNTYAFLNQSHKFRDTVDWDFNANGRLWTYNLNYFEFLEQREMSPETGYRLIDDFLKNYSKIETAHDPYPISLRIIFWIRFFIRQNCLPPARYLVTLHSHARELEGKLEYHLLGNHLLENAFALFFAGAYLNDSTIIRRAKCLLKNQLAEQILDDGGHFELSPMYHQLMLYRLLDIINMAKASFAEEVKEIIPFLESKASSMLGWMKQMCFNDGTFPLFNDAAYGIAPAPEAITAYAKRLGISADIKSLSSSGYRKWMGSNWEMIMDLGQPGPSYQPGHAHCDALSFVLQVNGKPVLVDSGTSVYGSDANRRKIERSTASHNTVQVGEFEQSELWGDFRMARKAKVLIKQFDKNSIEGSHNGFFFRDFLHKRRFCRRDNLILIEDEVMKIGYNLNIARFHFHPNILLRKTSDYSFCFGEGLIKFKNANRVEHFTYDYAPYFGMTLEATGLAVEFVKELTTEIHSDILK